MGNEFLYPLGVAVGLALFAWLLFRSLHAPGHTRFQRCWRRWCSPSFRTIGQPRDIFGITWWTGFVSAQFSSGCTPTPFSGSRATRLNVMCPNNRWSRP